MSGARGTSGAPGFGELSTPRLRTLAAATRPGAAAPAEAMERSAPPGAIEAATCDLCAEPIGPRHGHLVDLHERSLLCACRACSILFDRQEAGGDHYRLVPDRVRLLEDFRLSELDWLALRIPVDLAFFFHNSVAERVIALYPGPMGATESLLELDHWERMSGQNPVIADLEPDVEALLVNRTKGRREGWTVPIDACYELVALFRTRWKGLSGGSAVWEGIDGFFDDLRRRASVPGATGHRH